MTDDDGRYVLPDLPEADYDVWVRGYGLVDSPRVDARPGQTLDLTAVEAPTPGEAAQVYPANYWYSLMQVPEKAEFPGTGADGNGIPASVRTQAHWVDLLKQGCQLCHQLGNLPTREIPNADDFDSTEAAWAHRIMTGQRAANMGATINRFGRQRAIAAYADWTDRIMAGEVPGQPPRPQGRERDVVLTLWEWGGETGYIHDEIASDKRDPRVNAGGPVYGVEFANDKLVWVDPSTNEAHEVVLPVRDTPGEGDFRSYIAQEMPNPSFYFGDERIWNNPGNPHNPMMDGQGRVWMTHQIRGPGNPAWCREGSDNPYARHYPLERAARHVAYYDPATEEVELIDTCFNTHHLQFGFDDDDTLYLSSVSDVIGWVNTRTYDETGDAQASQGWCPTRRRHHRRRADRRVHRPARGARSREGPADGARLVRHRARPDGAERGLAASGGVPGQIVRLSIGDNPPESCIAEYYQPPFENDRAAVQGYSPRGVDIDRNGIVWTALSGSGHDREVRPEPVRGAERTRGDRPALPRGVDALRDAGSADEGRHRSRSADFHYYHWVDQFNTLGLGGNVPIATGSTSDSLLAFLPEEEEYVIMRVPYPLGFYSRGMDGRIDDPDAGWKGRAVWADYGTNAVWHNEGGKGTQGNLVKFQVRPHPLAH